MGRRGYEVTGGTTATREDNHKKKVDKGAWVSHKARYTNGSPISRDPGAHNI